MGLAVLYPRFDHAAIEERYASWQTQMLLRQSSGVTHFMFYEPHESARDVVADVEQADVLVVTDPLLLPSRELAARLRQARDMSNAVAAVPIANTAQHPQQQRTPPAPYLTLRELQETVAKLADGAPAPQMVTWDASDPGLFLCQTESLDDVTAPMRTALEGRSVAIATTDYVHRWSSLRGQTRFDLLDRISKDARAVLEFGCGEAPLGEALKKRQHCRFVGIELDPEAAAIAEKRIDAVYRGDVREIISILKEKFDWIIGGDIVEHLDEPWSFLSDLRHVAEPDARLLLSIPNLANASIINDLLRGRFDYVYMGLTCVGHLRFFTRQSLEDMLTIAGWVVEEISVQELTATPAQTELLAALQSAGVPVSIADVTPTGYYVIARNPS